MTGAGIAGWVALGVSALLGVCSVAVMVGYLLGLEEAAAVALLTRAKEHLVMAGYRTRRPEGPPEVRVRHELCRACTRAVEASWPRRTA